MQFISLIGLLSCPCRFGILHWKFIVGVFIWGKLPPLCLFLLQEKLLYGVCGADGSCGNETSTGKFEMNFDVCQNIVFYIRNVNSDVYFPYCKGGKLLAG